MGKDRTIVTTKVNEKMFLMSVVRDDPPFFEILKDRLLGLMMTGEELITEKQRAEELSDEFRSKRRESAEDVYKNELQSIRARALRGLRSVRADSKIAELAKLKDEWCRDIHLPHRRCLLELRYLGLNDAVKDEIALLVKRQRVRKKHREN